MMSIIADAYYKQRRVTSTPLFFDPEGYEPEEGLGRSDILIPQGKRMSPSCLGVKSMGI
jgi:hypothetical protein